MRRFNPETGARELDAGAATLQRERRLEREQRLGAALDAVAAAGERRRALRAELREACAVLAEAVRAGADEGVPVLQLAKAGGVSYQAVYDWLREGVVDG